METKRKALSQAGKKGNAARWHKQGLLSPGDNDAIPTQSQIKEKKEKEIKENEGIVVKHKDFYKNEFSKCIDDKDRHARNGYYRLIGTIYNEGEYENGLREPAHHILFLPNQLSFEDYLKLRQLAKKRDINILSKLKRIINNPAYTSGKRSLFLLLESWIEKEPIKGTNH